MNIWQTLPPNFTILAPMDGVTDIVFRQVVARAARPTLFVTEFTNVNSFFSEKGRADATARLAVADTDAPILAQIWGVDPEHFAFTAQNLPAGFVGIDINMGCPEKHVVKNGGGSALIRAPRQLSADIISATKTGKLPVSVKTRLGYTSVDEWREWLTHLLRQDIAALTVHLRTKKEMSKVPAHHELIPDIIALRDEIAPQTVLVFNGDFTAPSLQGTSLSNIPLGCMIGRGIFQNPFCFEPTPREHTKEELIDLLKYHLDVFDAQNSTKFEPLKRFFKIYINNFPGAAELRTQLMETTSTAEVRTLLP